ncbi:MAG: repeat-containing protein YrrB [Pedosphaera sp.]|nr:repeat-containing protein YrrB [Pedosphaera sp.]
MTVLNVRPEINQGMETKPHTAWHGWIIYILLALITFFIFLPAVRFDFVKLDDADYVTENARVISGVSWANVKWAFTTGYASNWHPLTWLSHMVDCQFYGLKPAGHHLTNLLFHVANTLLLFGLLRQLTGATWRSAMVAALFAWHPLHVESVAWISERKDMLSTFFWLLTTLAYVWYVRRPHAFRYGLMLLLFTLGLLSKPMLVTLPFVLLLLDYWPLKRIANQALRIPDSGTMNATSTKMLTLGALVMEKLPMFVLVIISCVVTFIVQQHSDAVISFNDLPLFARVTNALVSYSRYIGKLFWPQHLGICYVHPGHWSLWIVAGASAFLLVVSELCISRARRRPYLLVGWLWFGGTLVPVIGLAQVGLQAMADRYTYVPLIGIFIIIAWGGFELLKNWSYHKWILGLCSAGALMGCLILTSIQLQYWRNTEILCRHALEITSSNPVVQALLAMSLDDQNKTEEAILHYKLALRNQPAFYEVHYNLGRNLAQQGKLEEAATHYLVVCQARPDYWLAHRDLGFVLTRQGKLEEAIEHYLAALKTKTNSADTYNGLGVALKLQGKIEESVDQFSAALKIDPHFAEAHFNLGDAQAAQGKLDDAIAHYSEALRLKPSYAEAHGGLGLALMGQGKVKEAIAHYRQALKLAPDLAEVLNNLAWILATNSDPAIRNGPEAVQLAQRACKLTDNQQPLLLGTLAAALAEGGRYSEAVATATKARELAVAANQNEIVQKNEQLIEIYRSGKAYHEESR